MKSSRLESKLAKVKFKGIDGNQHKRWSVWLNSMQREEPYQNVLYGGAFAHASIFYIRDFSSSHSSSWFIEKREWIISHLSWITLFLGVHTLGIY